MFVRAGGRGYHDNKITNDPCKRWADDEEWPKKDQEKTRRRLKQVGASWPRTAAARRTWRRSAAGRRGTTPPCTYTLIQNLEFYLENFLINHEWSLQTLSGWWRMAQERSRENQEKTKASRGILATDGSGAVAHMAAAAWHTWRRRRGRSERHNSSLYVHIDPKFRILFGNFSCKARYLFLLSNL